MLEATKTRNSGDGVVGLDFGGTKMDIALADGAGNIVERARLLTQPAEDADAALGRAAHAARELTQAARRHNLTVVAYAAVTPGLPREDGVLLAPNLPGWERLPFQRLLAEQLEVEHVAVANDVRAGALAESRLGALRGSDPALYVSIGTGLAAALIAHGQVIDGAHGIAGEIGYTAIDLSATPTPGTAQLEEVVGGRALGLTGSETLGESLDAETLFASSDPQAGRIIDRALATLASAVANLALLVDPARIALGGGLMAEADRILPILRRRLNALHGGVAAPEVVPAHFLQDASLYGAITLALDSAARQATPVLPMGSTERRL